MSDTLKVGTTALPEPTSVKEGFEIIWSANSGRNSKGKSVGDVVAQKLTLDISWNHLSETEFSLIKSKMTAGYFSLNYCGVTYTGYRGELTNEIEDINNGIKRYRTVSTKFIEQ